MDKLTLSVRRVVVSRVRAWLERAGIRRSLSDLVEEYFEGIDGVSLVELMCGELKLDCGGMLVDPGWVKSVRPRSLGPPASALVRELRDAREGEL